MAKAPAVTLEQAEERFRSAHRAARRADNLSAALYDRWAAETLMHIRGQPRERACAMLVRTAIMLEIAVDRRGWPERIVGM